MAILATSVGVAVCAAAWMPPSFAGAWPMGERGRSQIARGALDRLQECSAIPRLLDGKSGHSVPWSLTLDEIEAGALLTEFLSAGDAAEPSEGRISRVHTAFGAGGIRIAASIGGKWLTVRARPRVDARGVWLSTPTFGEGRLETPVEPQHARAVMGESLWLALHGSAPIIPAGFQLTDGRRIRVVGVEITQHQVNLTLRTEFDQRAASSR